MTTVEKGSENMINVTDDIADFGIKELREAAALLKAYAKERPEWLGKGVKPFFNKDSGFVFLSDEDFNVAMLNDGHLEPWLVCSECGREGFFEEFTKEHNKCPGNKQIMEYRTGIGGGGWLPKIKRKP